MMGKVSPLSGVILVDKPSGITSHDVVARARKTLGIKKIGHAGTLDPFATGLLILLVGEGTKLSNYLMAGEKVYRATIRLGEKRDTGDLTGKVVETKRNDQLTNEDVKKVLSGFIGNITQMPPMYSALKRNGTPLYKFARRGVEVEREKRKIFIREIEFLDFDWPDINLVVACSKGTYIRTLAEDIGEALGSCAHLTGLRRTASGPFLIENAIGMGELEERDKVIAALSSLNESLPQMPEFVVEDSAARKILNGGCLRAEWLKVFKEREIEKGAQMKVIDGDGALLSIMEAVTDIRAGVSMSADSVVGKSLRVFNL